MTEAATENLKKAFEIASRAWSIVWKAFPVWTIIAGVLLWQYLSHIGRTDLFLPSLSNPQGLAAFLIGFVFLCGALVFALATPSMYFTTSFVAITSEMGPAARDTFPRLFGWLIFGALLTMAMSISRWKSPGFLTAAMAVGPVLDLLIRPGDSSYGERLRAFLGGTTTWGNCWRALVYVFIATVGGVLALTPQLLVWPSASLTTDNWWWRAAFAVLGAVGTAIVLLPALSFYKAKAANKPWQWGAAAFIVALGFMVFVFFVFLVPSMGGRLMDGVASDIGLRSQVVHTYRIKSDRFVTDDFARGPWSSNQSQLGYTVAATAPFIFGDIVLLCPPALDTPEELQEQSAKECVVLRQSEVSRLPQGPDRAA